MILARPQLKAVATWLASLVVGFAVVGTAAAQSTEFQPRYSGVMTPGAIGTAQLQHDGSLPGYFQPVEIKAPAGAAISLALQGHFDDAQPAPILVGLLIGPVYRLRVTNIPYHPGEELFPTIEAIHRLYPPAGQAKRFPIVVELTQEDLELALRGNFVTRVIYLEDPEQALPAMQPAEQIGYDTRPGEDPLALADNLGRPVAILRLGGRQPLVDASGQLDLRADCAPFVKFFKDRRYDESVTIESSLPYLVPAREEPAW